MKHYAFSTGLVHGFDEIFIKEDGEHPDGAFISDVEHAWNPYVYGGSEESKI